MPFQYFKNIPEVFHVLGRHLTFHHHIIYINLIIFAQLWLEYLGHHPLIDRPYILQSDDRPYILQSKRHHLVVVISSRINKSCLLLITQSQWYLMVPLKSIQKTHPMMAYSCVHYLIYSRHREGIFWVGLVQIFEIHTYSPLSTLLLHHCSIGQPLRVKHLFNRPNPFKFNHILLDNIRMVLRRAPMWLLFWG